MKRASKPSFMDTLPTAALTPGTLLPLLRERAAAARRDGTLPPIHINTEILEQDGIAFQVRLLEARSGGGSPHLLSRLDPALFVASISPSHVALLNRDALFDHHLIVATRAGEGQHAQLTQKDCEALLIVLTELDGLAWYDAGPAHGLASSCKHFDVVPLTEANLSPLPLDPLLYSARTDQPVWSVPGLPFRHACAPMDPDWTNPEKDCGASLHACYRTVMRTAGMPVQASTGSHALTGAYNLLITRKWLLLIPRTQECADDLTVMPPAFAGSFVVRTAAELNMLKRLGPMTALRQVSFPN